MGIRELLRGIFRIPAPFLGGILYTRFSPQAPFLFHMFLDVFIRIPLLLTMPRTLSRPSDTDEGNELRVDEEGEPSHYREAAKKALRRSSMGFPTP